MAVCIQYAKPSSGQNEGEIFGLDVAINNFLSAWFRNSREDKFICRPEDIPSFDHFKALAKAVGHDADARCVGLDPRHPKHNLENIACLFRPDPLIGDLIWRRQQLKGKGFATCGLVHTMSGERIARAVGELCTVPSDGTDALICPSEAVRDAVQNLWQIHTDYLNHRFGGSFRCPVMTPVIPLGIDTEKFTRLTAADKRDTQRKALGADDDEIVILFLGRLSFATKAHPLPLWLAAERAAQKSDKKIRVVMFGYFKPADMEPRFRNLVADLCKTAKVEFIMNDDPRFPDGLWAGADIFTSLSDNIQESFGLTPIEAMAAGLPAVITDWNGYRGGVRDGQEGFLIPTLAPPPAAGMAIAESYYNDSNYGVFLSGASQSTVVDIGRCAEALQVLAEEPAKRKMFGDNGRKRAQAAYDWKHIIKAYEDLWQELAEKRRAGSIAAGTPNNWQAAHLSYPNPWQMFLSFPSETLKAEDHLHIVMSKAEIAAILRHDMNFFVPELLVDQASMMELIEGIRRAGTPQAQDILAALPAHEHDRIWRCLGWMLKHGIAARGR
ncbi:MAG: glycosyltransferase family 4 protein [Alphaproteobacteria bacterium]|nr:glycosyltransferase family 4 protein [Alphaproteobacteria bacterium]